MEENKKIYNVWKCYYCDSNIPCILEINQDSCYDPTRCILNNDIIAPWVLFGSEIEPNKDLKKLMSEDSATDLIDYDHEARCILAEVQTIDDLMKGNFDNEAIYEIGRSVSNIMNHLNKLIRK